MKAVMKKKTSKALVLSPIDVKKIVKNLTAATAPLMFLHWEQFQIPIILASMGNTLAHTLKSKILQSFNQFKPSSFILYLYPSIYLGQESIYVQPSQYFIYKRISIYKFYTSKQYLSNRPLLSVSFNIIGVQQKRKLYKLSNPQF